ncbi:hypothetical protein Pmar_PMAR010355 [Perkinsus marinus ATCC 50983]|uniref:Uncharacterized protein n=1 Tax=Perkinsus marinus (strain ATCC 50983 / TXsc) TaxID=423536 RepID=C5KID2_PERM5|nr:hypothetical protein Pmar_PMAR010355 [Perkinsus marinus ATCC 50983]EER15759.1 hypothetical protein Pmar_PMAR010355 [Perkinsus marinus ATCC 50983]|eukprot:XP_002783963.1 hypothetical protein Pmar_PMAR010355 [Perkinsus marinus ATCC 50983]
MTHRSPVSRPAQGATHLAGEVTECEVSPEVLTWTTTIPCWHSLDLNQILTMKIRKALSSIRSHLPQRPIGVGGLSPDAVEEVMVACKRCVALAFKVKKLEAELSCSNERNHKLSKELRELRASRHEWEDQRDKYIDRLARVKEWVKLTKVKHKMEKAALMRAHEEELVMALSRQMESHKHDKGFDDDDHRLSSVVL